MHFVKSLYTRYVDVEKKSQKIRLENTINPLGLTILCISDTHSLLNRVQNWPQADMIIHAGDFSNEGEISELEKFHEEFRSLPYPVKIFIAGNHELSVDPACMKNPQWQHQFSKYVSEKKITFDDVHAKAMKIIRSERCPAGKLKYLQDEYCEIEYSANQILSTVKIYGSPWQPEFFDWAFNLPRGAPLAEKWSKIPTDTDILVTHGPPFGILDLSSAGRNTGCEELRKVFDDGTIQPRIHVFGHIHEAYGKCKDCFSSNADFRFLISQA